jgi:OHCU decarboxylase
LKEQKSVGLDQCTKEEFKEFKKLNDEYKKFGFPFILAIKNKSKFEILSNFKKRINSEPQAEFEEAIKQVKKIASLRLESLNSKNI